MARYLLQPHGGCFVDANAAASNMALSCTSYLTFPCFDLFLDNSSIEESVRKGHYAFQEYATLNWIQHARTPQCETGIGSLVALLHSCNFEHLLNDCPASTTRHLVEDVDKSMALNQCQRAYEEVGVSVPRQSSYGVPALMTNDRSPVILWFILGQVPYLLHRIFEFRLILEDLYATTAAIPSMLVEAYGQFTYK